MAALPEADPSVVIDELQAQLRAALSDIAQLERSLMDSIVDANTLADATRVRRTELAAAHQAAVRAGDDKAAAEVAKLIAEEYKGD